MQYQVNFPTKSIRKKFEKTLIKIPQKDVQEAIMGEIEKLAANPPPFGQGPFKTLNPPLKLYEFIAQYRLRKGDYRVLYDVDEERKVVWISALRKRSERTYK